MKSQMKAVGLQLTLSGFFKCSVLLNRSIQDLIQIYGQSLRF